LLTEIESIALRYIIVVVITNLGRFVRRVEGGAAAENKSKTLTPAPTVIFLDLVNIGNKQQQQ
jgi:hypothetical protein